MGHFKLPKKKERKTLADAPSNQVVYVVPWAMVIGSSRKGYLNLKFGWHPEPFGTADLPVWRNRGQWFVDVNETQHEWNVGEVPGPHCVPVNEGIKRDTK